MALLRDIDLHLHSTFSDGVYSPAELIRIAADMRVKAVSITDHDTVDGTDEALKHGTRLQVEVVPGIEISSWFGKQPLHILGYLFDHTDELFLERVKRMQQGRVVRNTKIIERLNDLGHPVTMEELQAYSPQGQTGRPHIAKMLQARGIVRSIDEAFSLYLRRNGAAYVERFRYPAVEAVAMIREAGGIAVLAHPGCIEGGARLIPSLLRGLRAIGLAGVEVYYSSHSPKLIRLLKKLAVDLDLVVTGGSDFHGEERLLPGLKRPSWRVPYHLLEIMKKNGQNTAS